MKKQQARILRVLEYESGVEWVNNMIRLREIKGECCFGSRIKGGTIREAIIGDAMKIFSHVEKKQRNNERPEVPKPEEIITG